MSNLVSHPRNRTIDISKHHTHHHSDHLEQLNDITKKLNTHINELEAEKLRQLTKTSTIVEKIDNDDDLTHHNSNTSSLLGAISSPLDLTSHFNSTNNSSESVNSRSSAVSANEVRRLQKKRTIATRIPDQILQVNKDIALSLTVKPSDRNFLLWFSLSCYFPLFASCIGPLANMISVAALVDKWRVDVDGNYLTDPAYVIVINSLSIVFGTISDISLLMNFSRRLNYFKAQIISISGWFIACMLLISIIIAESVHHSVKAVYPSEGFQFAILTAILYFINSSLLFFNFLGYFLGKYNDEFNLSSAQRGLIFYTVTFVLWLSAGAAIITRLIDISYGTSLYFCVVSVTTVGLGDIVPKSDGAKAFVLVYALGGLLILGLIVSTVRSIVFGNNGPIVFWSQVEKRRKKLWAKYSKLLEKKYEEDEKEEKANSKKSSSINNEDTRSDIQDDPSRESEINTDNKQSTNDEGNDDDDDNNNNDVIDYRGSLDGIVAGSSKGTHHHRYRRKKKELVKEFSDEDMFNLMELIRRKSHSYQRFLSLVLIVIIFVAFWLLGALAFYISEQWSYYDSVYFCFLCLLTIGYGVPSPTASFSKAFFVCWALGAIPLNTILISNVGDTLFIVCVDYSEKIMNFVLTNSSYEKFTPFGFQRKTLGDLEQEVAGNENSRNNNDADDNKSINSTKRNKKMDQLSNISTQLQNVVTKEMGTTNHSIIDEADIRDDLISQLDSLGIDHQFSHLFQNIISESTGNNIQILKTILKNQKDLIEFIDVLGSIEELLERKDFTGSSSNIGNRKGTLHSYEEWVHLWKLSDSLRKGSDSAMSVESEDLKRDKAFWISDKSPLKYPLDENNYFMYRYIRVLDVKMNQLLKNQIGYYNGFITNVELQHEYIHKEIDELKRLILKNSDDKESD